jgi:hypothetical protein
MKTIITLLTLILSSQLLSQINTKQNIGIHTAYGSSTLPASDYDSGDITSRQFVSYNTVSYNKDLWKNKLRISPSFSLGSYTNNSPVINEWPFYFFNSSCVRVNLYFNWLNVKNSTFFLGTGLTFSKIKGIKKDVPFQSYNYGINGCVLGYRYLNTEKRFGIESKILDFSLNPEGKFSEYNFIDIGLLINLK